MAKGNGIRARGSLHALAVAIAKQNFARYPVEVYAYVNNTIPSVFSYELSFLNLSIIYYLWQYTVLLIIYLKYCIFYLIIRIYLVTAQVHARECKAEKFNGYNKLISEQLFAANLFFYLKHLVADS